MEIISEMCNFFNCYIHCWVSLAEAAGSQQWQDVASSLSHKILGLLMHVHWGRAGKSHPKALFIAANTGFACSWGFPFPGAQPNSSERMLLLCHGTTRFLSQHCIQQQHQRQAPARLQGTHRRMVLCLTKNHRLRFPCLGFQRKLPAPSPRLRHETAELQASCRSFQQNPRGKKIKQISFPPWRTVTEWQAPGEPPEVSQCPTGSVYHVSDADISPFTDCVSLLSSVTTAPQFCSSGSWRLVNCARISALPEGSSTALLKTCSVKTLVACMPPAPPWGPAVLRWHQVMSPSVKEQQRKSLSWVGEEMNPGSRASSEMQIALQILSINYRAWASCWSHGENRPLAHIKFNGVWTPNSLSLFENQNPTFSRYICGQVKSLIPLQTATFLQHCVQQSQELSLRWWGVFLILSMGSRKEVGSDMWLAEVCTESSMDRL